MVVFEMSFVFYTDIPQLGNGLLHRNETWVVGNGGEMAFKAIHIPSIFVFRTRGLMFQDVGNW